MGGYAVKGNIVLPYSVLTDGTVIVEDGIIKSVMPAGGGVGGLKVYDCGGSYIVPGFVDIHCHGSPFVMACDDPAAAAQYHYEHGTTSMLLSLYRDLSFEKTLEAIDKIKSVMSTSKNIMGVHMEGPYLNPSLGTKPADGVYIDKKQYLKIADSGIIRQWTFAPEIDGSIEFCKDIAAMGIVPAVGHSCAGLEQVRDAARAGTRIVTHLTNATGYAVEPKGCGIKEIGFDSACLLQDGFYYEIINDKNGVHVKKDLIKLIIKTAGTDRIIGITDCYAGTDDGSDLNYSCGKLTGSKLTMDCVARNFLNLGLSVCEVFKITALNPAKAIGAEDTIGQIKPGCRAHLLVADKHLNNVKPLAEF